MKPAWLALATSIAAGASATATFTACATDTSATVGSPPPVEVPPGESDAGSSDGASDATSEGPGCSDCEYFPETCTPDALCVGGPFEADTAGGAFDVRTEIRIIRGRSSTDIWAAGALGAVAHFDGTSWTRLETGTQEMLSALWLRNAEEVAFGRLAALYSRGFAVLDGGVPADGWLQLAPSSAPTELGRFARTLEAAWAPQGAEWLWVGTRSRGTANTTGLWRLRASSEGNFEVQTGIPTSGCAGFGCRDILDVHGSSGDDLWAVGFTGATLRITGAQGDSPTVRVFNSQTWNALNGVWAASPSEAWAVGAEGTIRHYTGDPLSWDLVLDVPTSQGLNAVWGSSPSDVWAVGDGAVVVHWDGARWTRVKVAGLGARRPDLHSVWVPEPGQVWIGGQGVVLSLGGKP